MGIRLTLVKVKLIIDIHNNRNIFTACIVNVSNTILNWI